MTSSVRTTKRSEKIYAPDKSYGDITNPDRLPYDLCPDPEALRPAAEQFSMRINPYLLGLLQSRQDPLARQFIPDPEELRDPQLDYDPLAETKQSPAPLIIHRYPRRVLFLVSGQCAAHCRFCMRKRNAITRDQVDRASIDQSLAYIQHNRRINEVILSGGDPFMLHDRALIKILTVLKAIPHLRVLRIHTRIPIVWPQRITPYLAKRLSDFHPLYINIHVNHPDEITIASAQACELLVNAGIPLGSQTVLLKNINDDADVLRELFEGLQQIRVRPYYLHQIDPVAGTAHFKVPIDRGLSIIHRMHGRLSGMAVPHFMIDLPGGGGKVELLPDYIVDKKAHQWIVQNFNGQQFKVFSH